MYIGRNVAGRSFLDADFSLSCDSYEYIVWKNAVAIPLFICCTFGVPFVYACAMYRHVRVGALEDTRHIYGFLFSGFREERWWFELWNTLRKSLFTISAIVFAPAGTMMQTWAALVLLLLFLAIFLLSQPYEEGYLNNFEQSALGINVITLLLGLGLYTNNRASNDEGLNVFITFCIIGFNVVFVVYAFTTYLRYSQYCTMCKKKGETVVATVPATVVVPTSVLRGGKMKKRGKQKSYRTAKVEEIQKNHQEHRAMALKQIEKQQGERRSSLVLRVEARKKVKHSNVLSNSIYFSNLDKDSISKIVDAMECLVIDNGYEICRQGEVADIFYIIVSGTCQVTIDGKLVTVLNDFDVFGEQALFEESEGTAIRGATVTAATNGSTCIQLLALSKANFDRLIASGTLNEECVKTLKYHTAKRIRDNEEKMTTKTEEAAALRNDVDVVGPIQLLLKKAIQTPTRFRKIVKRLNKDGAEVNGNTMVTRSTFELLVDKIIVKVCKSTVSEDLMRDVLVSSFSTEVEVSCGTLEQWMRLDVVGPSNKANQTVEGVLTTDDQNKPNAASVLLDHSVERSVSNLARTVVKAEEHVKTLESEKMLKSVRLHQRIQRLTQVQTRRLKMKRLAKRSIGT